MNFERLCNLLKSCSLYGNNSLNMVFNRIATVAGDSYRKACKQSKELKDDKVNESRMKTLKDLKEDSSIHITKPDKGRGVVILDKTEYESKMNDILLDTTKFKLLNVDIATHIVKLEDKLNRILRGIKDSIGDFTYSDLYASGSKPGYMYGLPKVHKPGNPLRPIISTIGTFTYKLSKFLVPILTPLTKNQFTIMNSVSFVRDLCAQHFNNNIVMASFDVVSLFTNIPLAETTNIILDNLNDNHLANYGLEKSHMSKLLDLATRDSVFMFGDKIYNQIDGVGMGSCLGPVYADCFMGYHEKKWLDDCPVQFKPLYYRRYVDNTFLIFKDHAHIELFF